MASLTEILQYKYPGSQWSMTGGDYNTLVWYPANTLPKPSLAELQGFSAEVDAMMATEARQARQRDTLLNQDQLLRALSVLINAVVDLQTRFATRVSNPGLNATAVNQATAMKTRIDEINNAP